jgi:hypothetical protein
MGGLLSLLSGVSVKNYLYIAIAVIMIGMVTTITIQNLRIDNLKLQVKQLGEEKDRATALFKLISDSDGLTEDIVKYVDKNIQLTNEKFQAIKSKYRANYIEYLMNGGLCTDFCTKESFFDPSDSSCDITTDKSGTTPNTPKPSPGTTAAATKFKQDTINSMWEGYCTSNENAEECKQ